MDRFKALLTLAAFISCESSHAMGQTIDEVAQSEIRGLRSGFVLAVYHLGQIQFLEAFGRTGPETEEQMTPDHLFAFPDLAEVFLGATVQALADAEVLDIEAPISSYLPDLSPKLGRIRSSQLLTHTGGLDDAAIPEDQPWSDALDGLDDRAVFTEPGFVYSHSRYSFPLLRRVVEKVVGSPFDEIAIQAILNPLGMARSTFDPERARELGLVTGLGLNNDASSPYVMVAPTGEVNGLPVVFTTAKDLTQFLASWMNGGIRGSLPWADGVELGGAEVLGDTGFRSGVQIGGYKGLLRASRTGSGLGMGSGFYLFPLEDAAVVAWGIGGRPSRSMNLALERVVEALAPVEEAPDYAMERALDALGAGDQLRKDGPAEADTILPTMPVHPRGWAGTYLNGEYMVELREGEAGLLYFTGEDELPVTPGLGGLLVANREDGLVRIPFRLETDRAGRRYVRQGNKAFLHTADANTGRSRSP